MFVRFEDMVYNYDETTRKIAEWLKLSEKDHLYKYKYFNPEHSIKNTQTWKKIDCDQQEIAYIEKELKEYLYDFN